MGIFIGLIFLVFAAPNIDFVNPTPPDNNVTLNNWVYVNASISGGNTSFIDWNNSLVGWWRMNNETGENESYVRDWSGNGHNGTVIGATYNATGGKFGGGFEFDGEDDFINISDSNILSFGDGSNDNAFTTSVWVNSIDATQFEILGKENEYLLFLDGNDKIRLYLIDESGCIIGRKYDTALTSYQGNWIHIAATYNGNKTKEGIKLYFNGNSVETEGYTLGTYTAMENLGGSFHIGEGYDAYANGSIDDIIIFNRELSATEIKSLYSFQSGNYSINFTNLDDGDYTFKAHSQNLTGGVNPIETRTVTVYTKPAVTLNSPSDNAVTSNTSVNFNCSASINNNRYELSNVTLYTNYSGNFVSNGTNLFSGISNNTNFTRSFSIADKNFVWNCYVCDNESICGFASANRTLILDYTAPNLTLNSPTPENNSIITNSYIAVNFTLDEISSSTAFVDFNNSLLAWYRFNNESGESENYIKDWSGNGHNGTAINSPAYISDGVFGGAFNFSSSDKDYFSLSEDKPFKFVNEITLEAWIKWNNLSYDALGNIVGEGGSNYILTQYGNLVRFSIDGERIVTSALNDGEWHYVVGVYNGNQMQLWVDGSLEDSQNLVTTITSSSYFSSVNIGCVSPFQTGNCIDASIDEVRIWSRALSSEEIQLSYNAGSSNLINFTDLSNGNRTIKVYAQDSFGNTSSTETRNFEIWATPILTINSPFDGETNLFRNTTLNVSVLDYENDSMNITFLNSTNGTICQENNVASGSVVTCAYNNLQKETEYLWSLNITDGTTTIFQSQNFTVGVSWRFTENYDNKTMSFVWTGDDWDGSTRHEDFMAASNKAQEYGLWFSPGIITGGGVSSAFIQPIWEDIQTEIDEGYVSPVSHSRNHYNLGYGEEVPRYFTLENATLEVNGSKNDIEGHLTLSIYNQFNGTQKMVGWIAPHYVAHPNLTLALNMSNYLVHRGQSSFMTYDRSTDVNGWAGINESNGIYWDHSDISFSSIEAGNLNVSNFTKIFDDAYELGYQMHLMGHPGAGSANWSDGSIRDQVLEYIGNKTDVWYVGWGHVYMYRYMTNQSLPTVNVTTNPEDASVKLKANASSADRNKYGLSYPITYEISVPTNWTNVTVYYKNTSDRTYTQMTEKDRTTVWNGIDAYRKDLDNDRVYVSKAFPQTSNEMYLAIHPPDTTSPLVSFSLSSTSVNVGDTITSSCTGTDIIDDSPTVSYTTSPSTSSAGTHTTTCTITDYAGNSVSQSISYVVLSSNSGTTTYSPSSEQLEEGYSKILRKTQKVQFTINEETHTAVINSVNVINKRVEVELEEIGEVIELNEGEIKKIDLDDDGYYDLQISVNKVRINGYVDLEFKEIHDEVPAEEKEEQESPSKVEEIKIKNWMWIIGGIILLIIIGFVIKQLSKKK